MVPTQQLYKLETPEQVRPGDTVYEVVRFGTGDQHVKFKPCKVIKALRGGCRVSREDGSNYTTTLAFGLLMCERPKPTLQREPRERPVAAIVQLPERTEDAFSAWLDMGRGLIDELDQQREALQDEREALQDTEVSALLAQRVAELEAQLKQARRDMEAERERQREAMRSLDAQLAALDA